jgi:hypothetical protein
MSTSFHLFPIMLDEQDNDGGESLICHNNRHESLKFGMLPWRHDTIRNFVHTNPCVCNLCPNQPFLQLLMCLSSVAPCKNNLKSHM